MSDSKNRLRESGGSLSARYLDVQLVALDGFGFPRARALDSLGTTEVALANPRTRFALTDVARLYTTTARELGRECLGLEVGNAFRVAGFGKSGRIYALCRDLAEVIATNARYQKLAVDAGHISLAENESHAGLRLDPHYAEPERFRHVTELVFGGYGTAFRWLGWSSGTGIAAVHLRHAAPSDTSLHERVFGCPVHFGARHNRLDIHPDALRQPLPTSDPNRLAIARERLDRLLAEPGGESFHDAFDAAVRTCLRDGRLSLACCGEVLGRSERELRADLKREGLTYREAVDAVRRAMFAERVDAGDSLVTVAGALGYNDQAAFTRAFKRWHGVTPSAWMESRDA